MATIEQDSRREDFINRGLGTSPVASRDLRRRDLTRTRTLRSEVINSRARADAEKRNRALSIIQSQARQQMNAPRSSGTGGGSPLGTLVRDPKTGEFVLTQNTQPGAGSARITETAPLRFKSLRDFQAFLRDRSEFKGRLVTPTGQGISADEATELGIRFVSGTTARQVLGRSAQPGGLRSFARIFGGKGSQAQQEVNTGRRSEPTPDQKTRGKLDSGINAVNAFARIGTADAIKIQRKLGIELSQGRGSTFIEMLIKAGVIKL